MWPFACGSVFPAGGVLTQTSWHPFKVSHWLGPSRQFRGLCQSSYLWVPSSSQGRLATHPGRGFPSPTTCHLPDHIAMDSPHRPPAHQHRPHTPTTLPGAGLTSLFYLPVFQTFCNTCAFFLIPPRALSPKEQRTGAAVLATQVSGPLPTSCGPPSRRQGPRWGPNPLPPR